MRRFLTISVLVAVALFASVSCSNDHSAKVIPSKKMEQIYREMFLADQWLAQNPELRNAADTTWFYEPIFEKYGYTADDYRNSVDYYLNDPERFAEMMGKVVKSLQGEANSLMRQITAEERMKHKADSVAALLKSSGRLDYQLYENLFLMKSRTDTIHVGVNSDGVYFPDYIKYEDEFDGPAIVSADSMDVIDTVKTEPAVSPLPDETSPRPQLTHSDTPHPIPPAPAELDPLKDRHVPKRAREDKRLRMREDSKL